MADPKTCGQCEWWLEMIGRCQGKAVGKCRAPVPLWCRGDYRLMLATTDATDCACWELSGGVIAITGGIGGQRKEADDADTKTCGECRWYRHTCMSVCGEYSVGECAVDPDRWINEHEEACDEDYEELEDD